MDRFDDSLRKLGEYVDNEYIVAVVLVFVIVYASKSQIELPNWLESLFKNDIFKVLYLSLLLMIPFEKAPHVSIIVAVLFVIVLHVINRSEMKKLLSQSESFRNLKRKR